MIPYCPLIRGLAEDAGIIQKAVDRVLRSGQLILGPEVEAFEREWADWVGARYCIGVASGTDAIKIALRACGIEPSGSNPEENPLVLTQGNSAPATASAIQDAGAWPYFLDVVCPGLHDDSVWNCLYGRWGIKTPAGLPDAFRFAALVPVSLYGLPNDCGEEFAEALDRQSSSQYRTSRRQTAIVNDLCQFHNRGAWTWVNGGFGGKHPTRPTAGCFSFYPTKALGSIGDGGAIVTDSEDIAAACRELRQYGYMKPEVVGRAGWNSRLDEIQAAVLRERLRIQPRRDDHRARLAAIYREESVRGGWSGRLVAGSHIVAGLFPRRDEAASAMADAGVQTRIHYRIPLGEHPQWAYTRFLETPGTARWCAETLSLPYSNWTTEAEARTAADGAGRIMVEQMGAKT